MAFTTINKSTDYFNTVLYQSNNGSAQSITGVNFQPDFLWVKDRTAGGGHVLVDAVRGSTKMLSSNSTSVEVTRSDQVTSFDSNGFSLGADSGNFINYSTNNNVSWNWKANGTGSSNTDGSITSTVSVNTTSGFSIVKYTGTGNGGVNTVGHGLGVIPKVIIIKALTTTQGWYQYHEILGNTKVIDFTGAAAVTNDYWSDTTPTASVFNVIGNTVVGGNYDYIAYCFAEKQGYSKMGSYVGNGNADGRFVYTGFKPAYVIAKRTDNTGNWNQFDNKRFGFNVKNPLLYPNLANAEADDVFIDLLSNGFKFRTTNGDINASGGSYIYMAFAEAPLVGTNNVPANAR